MIRKMIKYVKPKCAVTVGSGAYSYKSISSLRTIETKCQLGQEFVEDIPDGSKSKVGH